MLEILQGSAGLVQTHIGDREGRGRAAGCSFALQPLDDRTRLGGASRSRVRIRQHPAEERHGGIELHGALQQRDRLRHPVLERVR